MIDNILREIDAEIARLQQARTLLTALDSRTANSRAGNAAGNARQQTKRTMSAEGRERVRQAQIKRWADKKKVESKIKKTTKG